MKIQRLGAIVAIGLLAACGGADDAEPAASSGDEEIASADEPSAEDEPADEPSAEDEPADEPSAEDDANDADDADDDGNTTSINSLDDIPQECRDVMGEFLREIEPIVSGVDWENATVADLTELGTAIDVPLTEIDTEMDQAGCNDIDFDGDDDRGFELSLELAREEAPGVVGWLEFVREISQDFDTAAPTDDSAEAPETCDEAVAGVRDLMDKSDSMLDLPVEELLSASSTIQAVTSVCSVDEMGALLNDPEFQAWSGG